jgi:nucleoid DNA-binding protein
MVACSLAFLLGCRNSKPAAKEGERPLTKADFIDRVASKSGLSKRDATKAVDAFLDSVTEALRRDEAVTFTGFGKFSPQQRKERQGVNPRTGQRVTIPAARVPKFSAGSQLKQALRQ